MHGLLMIALLATDLYVLANLTHHYFLFNKVKYPVLCNWQIQISCEDISVIDILEVIVLNTSCNSCACYYDYSGDISTDNGNRTIPEYIRDKCHHRTTCNSSLPHPGITGYATMTNVTVNYNCTERYSTTPTTSNEPEETTEHARQNTQTTAVDTTKASIERYSTMITRTSKPEPTTEYVTQTIVEDTTIVLIDGHKGSSTNTVVTASLTCTVIIVIVTATLIIISCRRRRQSNVNTVKTTSVQNNTSVQDGKYFNVVSTYEDLLRQSDEGHYSPITRGATVAQIPVDSAEDVKAAQGQVYVNVMDTVY